MKIRYWCNTHRRPAPPEYWGTYIDGREYRMCNPKLGGIMIPCRVIDCDEVGIEITTDDEE